VGPDPAGAGGAAPLAGRPAAAGRWHWLGRVPFAQTADLQERLRRGIRDDGAPETLLLLEHEPVITLGRGADTSHVLHSEASLALRGVSLHRASRGGDVTYHGPGQLVGYPIVRLRTGVRAHVEGMATAIAGVLARLGVAAYYRADAPGLWVNAPADAAASAPAKICAFGVNVHHRITTHGFALNLAPDLEAFRLIVPCGLAGSPVTSVASLRGGSPTPAELSDQIAEALGAQLKVAFAKGDTAFLNCNTASDP